VEEERISQKKTRNLKKG